MILGEIDKNSVLKKNLNLIKIIGFAKAIVVEILFWSIFFRPKKIGTDSAVFWSNFREERTEFDQKICPNDDNFNFGTMIGLHIT